MCQNNQICVFITLLKTSLREIEFPKTSDAEYELIPISEIINTKKKISFIKLSEKKIKFSEMSIVVLH